MLFNINTLQWDDDLSELSIPEVHPGAEAVKLYLR